jgi:hypothetical protein
VHRKVGLDIGTGWTRQKLHRTIGRGWKDWSDKRQRRVGTAAWPKGGGRARNTGVDGKYSMWNEDRKEQK